MDGTRRQSQMSSLETLFMNSKHSRTQKLNFLKKRSFSTAQGFSLTEIMVALLISSILMYGVMTIMSSGKRTYALQSELAELYDNARFVMEDITFTLRMAGFKGFLEVPTESKTR
jgi:prepilin-type N-terminal cleavage/methylation domain-containing protein